MEKDFDYNLVPYSFTHCVRSSCVRANDCIRYRAMQYATPDRGSLSIVNPVAIPGDGKKCRYFFADQKVRYALGISRLLDNIPYKKAVMIRSSLRAHFRKATYYRIRNKERLITPAEQDFVRQLFQQYGIGEEPVFDTYIEQYQWQ